MRLAVTGCHGQVVTALIERALPGVTVIPLGRPQFDLADPATIAAGLARAIPDAVVSAGAYTAVDQAENDETTAFAINGQGAGAVAAAAAALNVPLIHLSTDYVFDGSKSSPYVETDPVAPLGVYGRSKLAGERAVMAAHPGAVVLRTAWVYSPFGSNFLKTMLRLAATRDTLGVVADQIGNPTSALDLADAIQQIARRLHRDPADAPHGVYHLTATGEASWAQFAAAIFAASSALGGHAAQVNPIATRDYPTPATRPANSRLCCDRIAHDFSVTLPPWQQSTQATVARLIKELDLTR